MNKLKISKAFAVVVFLFLAACASTSHLPKLESSTSDSCRKTYLRARKEEPEKQLNTVSDLFNQSCFNETIRLGSFIRDQHREKVYQVTAELAEIVTPEGTFTQYVMESYERTYLSLLISMSYLNMDRESDALVELRRSQDEAQAFIYNYGSDSALTLLQAALWDRFDPGTARPYWKKLDEDKTENDQVRKLAHHRLQQIDAGGDQKVSWKIYGMGYLPELDWKSDFLTRQQGVYQIVPKQPFPQTCSDGSSILVPTSSWTNKIAMRYNSSYHPLLLAKSLVRLPIGIGYGIVGVSAGVAVGVGGCIVTAKDQSGQACGAALEAAGYLIKTTGDVVEYTLKPDLRHWEKVPMAFYLTTDDPKAESLGCLRQAELLDMKTVYLIQ